MAIEEFGSDHAFKFVIERALSSTQFRLVRKRMRALHRFGVRCTAVNRSEKNPVSRTHSAADRTTTPAPPTGFIGRG
jgi:hypothetical protein